MVAIPGVLWPSELKIPAAAEFVSPSITNGLFDLFLCFLYEQCISLLQFYRYRITKTSILHRYVYNYIGWRNSANVRLRHGAIVSV
jgi:hypothetical protein